MMKYTGQKILVVGAGRSGLAAAEKLLRMDAEVFLTDMQPKHKIKGLAELGLDESHLVLEREPDLDAINPSVLVLSPGVSPQLPFIQEALRREIPVWSEVELALRDSQAMVVAITGSNGKTTTTTLVGELARETGKDTIVAGNIGIALSGQVDQLKDGGIVVAELSSFQLEHIDQFRPQIAMILNITPDHLDRHGTVENYAAAKVRILENQTEKDLAVLNWDDPMVRGFAELTNARVMFFSLKEKLDDGICMEGDQIVFKTAKQVTPIIGSNELLLRGNHNIENVMAAVAAARELGVGMAEIAKVLRRFTPVQHRQEIVGEYDQILFINDSKGTNPDSSIKALQSYDQPIVLIAGGKNKGLDMTEFLVEAKKKVKSLVLVGEASAELEKIARELQIPNIILTTGYADCVEKAIAAAVPGDVVLLSPACTSWDMFKSYEDRGELFKELVRKHYSEPD